MLRASRFLCALLALAAITGSARAQAHPLGNFTINHLARIESAHGALRVRYVLDIAEIPAFQIMHARGGDWSARSMRLWASAQSAVIQSGLHVGIDGNPAQLQVQSTRAMLRPGAGGLPILRWAGEFSVRLADGAHHITVRDDVYADRRIGWKDIVIGAGAEPTNELRRYPSALIASPRRVNAATFTVQSGGGIANVQERSDDLPAAGTIAGWVSPTALSDMFARRDQTPLFVILTVLAAFGLGALHAIEPGHGKALLAFTLVGARATPKQALTLAVSLTVAHTAGVLLLGVVLFAAAGFVSESIYPWITLLSGVAIAIIGARALAKCVRTHRGRDHQHVHDHGGSHAHSHGVPGYAPLNFGTAVLAAMSGGVAPCPAAIVVMLAALRLHQLGYGLFLILVFSMGLASVLSGLGIGVVRGAARLSQHSAYARFASFGPLITAFVISVIGAWTLATGFVQQGVAGSVPEIAFITLAAIAGYALAQRGHEHVHAHVHAETHPV